MTDWLSGYSLNLKTVLNCCLVCSWRKR